MEHDLQKQIISYLRMKNVFCFQADVMDGLKFCTQRTRFPFITHHKQMGYVKGQPDAVLLLEGGKCVFLEVKTEKGKQSPEQKAFQEKAENLGFEYHIVRSINDVDIILKNL